MEKAQYIFFKEFYGWKSTGDTNHLNRHMQVYKAKHAGVSVNPATKDSGTQTLLSHSSSSSSLRVFNYNPSNTRYQLMTLCIN